MPRATARAARGGALLLLLAGAALLLARPAGAQAVSKPRGGRGRERPADFDRGGGLRQAEQELRKLLRACGKGAPKGAAVATSRGVYISSLAGNGARVAGFEVRYGGRDYHFSMQKTGRKWNIVGKVTPNPCGTETLALTMDDVDAYNAADLGWVADMSPLVEGKTVEELSRLVMPLEARGAAERAPPARRQMSTAPQPPLPEAYDARARLSTEEPCAAFDVQYHADGCGACSMFAFTTATAARLCLQHGRDPRHNVVLSAQQLMEASIPSCASGASGRRLSNLYNAAPPRWKEAHCYPYTGKFPNGTARPCVRGRDFATGGGVMPLGEADIRAELLLRGPLYVAIVAYSSIFSYKRGIYRPGAANDRVVGGHAMALVGWGAENGTAYWIVQNAWGTGEGEGGFMRIVRGVNAFDIESREVLAPHPLPAAQCNGTVCPMGWRLLATNCTCEAPSRARATVQAAGDAAVLAARAAEDAARAAVRQQRGGITYGGQQLMDPGGVMWLARSAAVCYRFPEWQVFEGTQNLSLFLEDEWGMEYSLGVGTLPQVNFLANASARVPREGCGAPTNLFTMWNALKAQRFWRLYTLPAYITTAFFQVSYLRLDGMKALRLGNGDYRLIFAWTWEAGESMDGDVLSLVSKTGAVRYNQTFSRVSRTGTSFFRLLASSKPNGPYAFQLFRGDQTTPLFTSGTQFPDASWSAFAV